MTEKTKDLLIKYSQFMGKPSKNWMIAVGISSVFVLIGFYAFIQQVLHEHVITGMRDNVVWGMYIVNFIFILGISYAGAIISGIFHLGRMDWAKPLIRVIEIVTFISILIGPIYILLCIGRLDRLHYLFIHARIQSPIIWDLIAVMLDLVLATIYLYLTFIKDFHLLHTNAKEINAPQWKINIWKKLSLGYKGTENQKKRLNRALDIMASIIIPVAVIAYSLLAWLFGMNLREGWDDSIFAPYFIISAILSGLATITILMFLINKFIPSKNILTCGHFHFIGYGMGIFGLIFGYFTFSDYITRWYNTSLETTHLIEKYLDFDQYGYMTIFTMTVTSVLPALVAAVPKFRNKYAYTASAVLVLFGLWLFRYLLIVPVLETPSLPVTSIDPATIKYSATWIEWSLLMAGFAGGLILFLIITKFVPIFPLSEMEEKHTFRLFGKYNFRDLFEEKDFSTESKTE